MSDLLREYERWFAKSLLHLRYSAEKLAGVTPDVRQMDERELEGWEGLVSRFSRASDILFSKVLRLKALEADPGFRGTFIDLVHFSEKNGWLFAGGNWRRMRELRNLVVHEYAAESINRDLQEILRLSADLLRLEPLCGAADD